MSKKRQARIAELKYEAENDPQFYERVYDLEQKGDAQELGRRGGQARAKNLTKKQLSEAGKKAIMARWAKRPKPAKEGS